MQHGEENLTKSGVGSQPLMRASPGLFHPHLFTSLTFGFDSVWTAELWYSIYTADLSYEVTPTLTCGTCR